MVRPLTDRAHILRKLIQLKCGPGAAVFPPEVTRLHLDFALSWKNGHMGPRKFFQENLPRLKYHNPSIPMIVNRHTDNDRAPTLTVYLRKSPSAAASSSSSSPDGAAPAVIQPASSRVDLSKAQPPAPHERTVEISMQNKHSSDILDFLIAETGARALQPTAEEIREMQELEEKKARGDVDRQNNLRKMAERQREADMLKQAREAAGIADDDA